MTTSAIEAAPDGELWLEVRRGSVAAFEVLVRRHQSVVASVAYGACGNLALSEDVAQETFWAAWRDRLSTEPGHLRAWLCGIARNLGHNAARRSVRTAITNPAPLDLVAEPAGVEPEPGASAVSREEEALVWETLRAIPESYREPLILFYREGQSVAEVASTLGLSEDAAKQRLSRGRALLRERVAGLVESGLGRSRPGRRFTGAVMAGLVAAGSSGAKVASAAGAGLGTKAGAGLAAQAGLGASLSAGALSGLVGLGGGYLGTWLPAQLAPTRPERDLILRTGRRILLLAVLFIMVIGVLIWAFAGRPWVYAVGLVGSIVGFQGLILVETIRLNRAVRRLRVEVGPDPAPNNTAVRRFVGRQVASRRGRVYRSRATLLGWPLVDINVGDPALPGLAETRPVRKAARGWIAVGDDARGLLVAIGSTAVGPIALGTSRGFGLIAFGGVAVGGIALGGFAAGGVALGGLGLGVLALGGGAVGVWAAGGMALAWDTAAGGLALARRAAFGGLARAGEFAVGGVESATHANDAAARAALLHHPLVEGMNWFNAHLGLVIPLYVAVLLGSQFLILTLMYRRDRPPEGTDPAA